MSNLEERQRNTGMSNLDGRQKNTSTSNLEGRTKDTSMLKSENMIQYGFSKYNGMGNDSMEGIKSTPKIVREVHEARENYKEAKKTRQGQNEQMPIVSAQDIKNEMYR